MSGIDKYIEIDARETTKNYLKEKISQSYLSHIYNLSNVTWEVCLLDSIKSFVSICANYYNLGMTTYEISEKIHFPNLLF